MYKIILSLLVIAVCILKPCFSFAWGREGHQIVAQIAEHFLSDSTKKKVQNYLGKTSFEDAATWMDESRSNDFYGYMRTWHYINVPKDSIYRPTSEKNILTVLHAAITELKNRDNFKKSTIKTDLYMVFHLVGDLHQPLHVGYPDDRGGNDKSVSYLYKSYNTNLHSVWDTEIIQSEKIDKDSCLMLYPSIPPDELASIKKINELQWFRESRALLEKAYVINNDLLDKTYVMNAKYVVERRLLLGGIRLAAILEEIFK